MAKAISHGKRHYINSTKDHRPTMGDHDENSVVVMDANGLPVKDSGVQLSAIAGGMIYQDVWNVVANNPVLSDATGTRGHYYIVTVPGTRDLGSGNVDWGLHDWAVHNGTKYDKIDNSETQPQWNADVDLAGEKPSGTDITHWNTSDRGLGIGAVGKDPFLMFKRTNIEGLTENMYIRLMLDQQMQRDKLLSGETPVDADFDSWDINERGQAKGTTGREFYVVKRTTGIKYVELS